MSDTVTQTSSNDTKIEVFASKDGTIIPNSDFVNKPNSDLYGEGPSGLKSIYGTSNNEPAVNQIINPNLTVPRLGFNVPKIKLPIFDGDYLKWDTFRDTFTAIVHNRTDLDDVLKFTILIEQLTGDAKKAIGFITLSSDGYRHAWAELVKRYDNTPIITDSHIDALINLPSCSRESSVDLRKLINDCVCHVTSLQACNLIVEGLAERMLVNIVKKKLDYSTRKEWEIKGSSNADRTWLNLLEFLQNKCLVLECLDSSKKAQPLSNINSSNTKGSNYKNSNFRNFNSKNSNSTTFTQSCSSTKGSNPKSNGNSDSNLKNKCYNCKKSHRIYDCYSFLSLSGDERYNRIVELKACINCLYPTHDVSKCNVAIRCKYCKEKHNSLLHDSKAVKDNVRSKDNSSETSITPSKSLASA